METMTMERKQGFNSNELKIFAIIAMTIDHVTCILWPGYDHHEWWIYALHLIGRLTAPTMWFFIVEGYHHTKNLKKYAARLFIFAFLAHFAYNFCFGIPFIPFKTTIFNQTSVMWSLGFGVVAIYIEEHEKLKNWQKLLLISLICVITFPSDWSCIAVLCILGINRNRGNLEKQMLAVIMYVFFYAVVYCIFIDVPQGILQMGVVIVYPFMKRYNGERGNLKGMKWFFYVYYVAHLLLLGFLRLALHGNVGMIIGG